VVNKLANPLQEVAESFRMSVFKNKELKIQFVVDTCPINHYKNVATFRNSVITYYTNFFDENENYTTPLSKDI